jgi:hypothetical protein
VTLRIELSVHSPAAGLVMSRTRSARRKSADDWPKSADSNETSLTDA